MSDIVYSQKQKLLLLQKILLEKTDENHSLTVVDIIRELGFYGVKVERKTVYDDVRTLTDFGMDIVVTKQAHANSYYVGSRLFEQEELAILVDAVASSRFLTKKKSNELIRKLQIHANDYNKKKLKRNIYVTGRVKSFNEALYYNISSVQNAIFTKHKISFKYYEYNLYKKKQLKHRGQWYTVSPYDMIWENDNYYLICYCNKHKKICRYRVDKIAEVFVSDEKCRELNEDERDIAKSLRSMYSMYGGTQEKITVEFDNSLIGVVIDRYGTDVSIHEVNDKTFKVFLDVQISPTFWGWLFQFGNRVKITAPQRIVEQAKLEIYKLAQIYK